MKQLLACVTSKKRMTCLVISGCVALATIFVAACAQPEPATEDAPASGVSQETVKEEVLAAQKRFYQAYESCDAEAMESLVTDDMMYLHSTGDLQSNKTELLESMVTEDGEADSALANLHKMRENREPIGRPRQVYIGENKRKYVPIKNR